MVVLPVFLQAPWVRLDPFSATLFTGVLVAAGLVMHQSRSQTTSDLGSLLVGFSGSWLAGCIFWGWLRAHPVLHLPVEAFAVPVALGGLQGRWRLAATFYLSSLVGTACTDLAMAATGVMQFWPAVVTASLDQAPLLLHQAGTHLLQPLPLVTLVISAVLVLLAGRRLSRNSGGFTSGIHGRCRLDHHPLGGWLVLALSLAAARAQWPDRVKRTAKAAPIQRLERRNDL